MELTSVYGRRSHVARNYVMSYVSEALTAVYWAVLRRKDGRKTLRGAVEDFNGRGSNVKLCAVSHSFYSTFTTLIER